MARRNPSPLVIFGNPPKKIQSESEAWKYVQRLAQSVQSNLRAGLNHDAATAAEMIGEVALGMLAQVKQSIHANPRTISRPTVMSHHVQAIAYVHATDGGQYVHGFGDVELNEDDLKRGILKLSDLKMRTHVDMIGYPDGTVTLIGTKRQPLAALFPE